MIKKSRTKRINMDNVPVFEVNLDQSRRSILEADPHEQETDDTDEYSAVKSSTRHLGVKNLGNYHGNMNKFARTPQHVDLWHVRTRLEFTNEKVNNNKVVLKDPQKHINTHKEKRCGSSGREPLNTKKKQ